LLVRTRSSLSSNTSPSLRVFSLFFCVASCHGSHPLPTQVRNCAALGGSRGLHQGHPQPLVARFCPLLVRSPIVSHSIFLGVPVGPAVTAAMAWGPVILKMANRVRSIALSGTNVSVNCALFVKRVIPILSYVSQFFPPDPRLPSLEVTWVSRLWRAPGIWVSRPMMAHMMKWSKTYMQVPIASLLVHSHTIMSSYFQLLE